MKSNAKPFKENLNRLFDIAVIEIETIIPSDKKRSRDSQKNDLEFLKDQRGPRKEYLGTEDNVYKEKVADLGQPRYLQKKKEYKKNLHELPQ